MNRKAPHIALIDPLWVGHHPMYFGQFAAAFLDLGAKVTGFCPDPEKGAAEIHQAAPGHSGWDTWAVPSARPSVFNGRFEGDPYHTFARWQEAATAIENYEKSSSEPIDAVYFPYLDNYLRFLPVPGVPASTIGLPWGGLYLRNHHFRDVRHPMVRNAQLLAKGDALLRSPLCCGIGVLDERYVDPIARHSGCAVSAFPDVTLADVPAEEPPLVASIRHRARGRKIVGLIGLERRKGMLTLLDVALRAAERRQPWYFVFAGVFDRNEFDADEQAKIDAVAREIASGTIDHIHFDPSAPRIPTEPEFNALFRAFDLAWAAYLRFPGSSGTLGKAAAFEIPVIATAGECIGQRVERYRMGETIPEGDAAAAHAAVERILASDSADRDFEGYRNMHSPARLREVLGKWLAQLTARI